MAEEDNTLAALTADIVSAHVSNNDVALSDLPALIRSVHDALGQLGKPASAEPAETEHVPAVTVRKSLSRPDKILSLIDGKPYSTLKRHLKGHGLTPEEYRQRYGLKADYPMVAPAYAEQRRTLANQIGLGRKKAEAAAAAPAAKPAAKAAPKPAAPAKSSTEAKPAARKKLGVAAAKEAAQQHLGEASAPAPAPIVPAAPSND